MSTITQNRFLFDESLQTNNNTGTGGGPSNPGGDLEDGTADLYLNSLRLRAIAGDLPVKTTANGSLIASLLNQSDIVDLESDQQQQDARLTAIEQEIGQPFPTSRIDALEAGQQQQDTRLDDLENKNQSFQFDANNRITSLELYSSSGDPAGSITTSADQINFTTDTVQLPNAILTDDIQLSSANPRIITAGAIQIQTSGLSTPYKLPADATGANNGDVLKFNSTTGALEFLPDGEGSQFDQDLNTTNDVVFNSVSIGKSQNSPNTGGQELITKNYGDSSYVQKTVSLFESTQTPYTIPQLNTPEVFSTDFGTAYTIEYDYSSPNIKQNPATFDIGLTNSNNGSENFYIRINTSAASLNSTEIQIFSNDPALTTPVGSVSANDIANNGKIKAIITDRDITLTFIDSLGGTISQTFLDIIEPLSWGNVAFRIDGTNTATLQSFTIISGSDTVNRPITFENSISSTKVYVRDNTRPQEFITRAYGDENYLEKQNGEFEASNVPFPVSSIETVIEIPDNSPFTSKWFYTVNYSSANLKDPQQGVGFTLQNDNEANNFINVSIDNLVNGDTVLFVRSDDLNNVVDQVVINDINPTQGTIRVEQAGDNLLVRYDLVGGLQNTLTFNPVKRLDWTNTSFRVVGTVPATIEGFKIQATDAVIEGDIVISKNQQSNPDNVSDQELTTKNYIVGQYGKGAIIKFDPAQAIGTIYEDDNIEINWDSINRQPSFRVPLGRFDPDDFSSCYYKIENSGAAIGSQSLQNNSFQPLYNPDGSERSTYFSNGPTSAGNSLLGYGTRITAAATLDDQDVNAPVYHLEILGGACDPQLLPNSATIKISIY